MNTRNAPSNLDVAQVLVVCSYLLFSGIYWLPGISHGALLVAKGAAYALLVLFGFLRLARAHVSQLNLTLWLMGSGLIAFVTTSLSSDVPAALDTLFDFVKPAFWLIALLGIRPRAFPVLARGLFLALILFILVAAYPILAFLGLAPNLTPPADFIDVTVAAGDQEGFFLKFDQTSVAGGGFAGQSTTWAVIVPPATLLLISFLVQTRLPNFKKLLATLTVSLIGIATIAVTSARGGTITLALLVLYLIFFRARVPRRDKVALVLSIPIVLIIVGERVIPENFLRGFEFGGDLLSTADAATTGRLGSWIFGIEAFITSPIIGIGPSNAYYGMLQIHNTYLKILAESGVLVFVAILILSAKVFLLAKRSAPGTRFAGPASEMAWPDVFPAIISGFVLALFEPNTIFGNFHASAWFWTAAWIALVAKARANINGACA